MRGIKGNDLDGRSLSHKSMLSLGSCIHLVHVLVEHYSFEFLIYTSGSLRNMNETKSTPTLFMVFLNLPNSVE